jgi:hypothetical protein
MDDLLWPENSRATMHDAELLSIAIDYVSAQATLILRVWVGDPSSAEAAQREEYRNGVLEIHGLAQFSIEPASDRQPSLKGKGLRIDADLDEPAGHIATGENLGIAHTSDKGIAFWVYVNDSNSFMRVRCERVSFRWSDERKSDC